ncbi:adenosine deaminase [Phenylobacterium sp. Root77]|uniref:adenosine deaminase n=1 Tax=unclassified Phenylobacterium TaxID=2640670 RepID=UPI0006F7284A|nr:MULTISPECIES: adenosine deaminase [unclassified Phenylobacterium]KQW73222.1 adenosine deaminase [Phenylobacterium sp. Root1277]KQW92442.1 adenosine deaminase [Phenylobacterium sp. Root1290]KRC40671.1 adenosine deaminase [Phenylobacterium sp. Root77]
MGDLAAFIRGLPKAELHLHIEGSLEPEQMFEFARRNGVSLPFANVEEVRAAYAFSNLQDFLDIYYQGAQVLLTKVDFHDLAMAYFRRIADDGARHAEIFFDPQTHTDRGVPFSVVIEGLLSGMDEAEQTLGVTSKLILCFLRHLSEEAAFETLEQARPYLDRIAGVGLDSSEVGHPPSKFARVFAASRKLGLKVVAHAGEEGPPDYVYEALDLLEVDRIDHGNRALEDDALTERLVREGMTLTVCPLSNLKLCVVGDLTVHPLKRMLDLGLRATINSDDPAYFGGYLGQNWTQTAQALSLTREELVVLARNSFTGSFLAPDEIARHLAEIDAYVARSDQN